MLSPAPSSSVGLIVVQNRAGAGVLGEQRVAAEAEQIEVKRLVGLLLVIALDFDRDGLRRLAGGESQRAGLGDLVLNQAQMSPASLMALKTLLAMVR